MFSEYEKNLIKKIEIIRDNYISQLSDEQKFYLIDDVCDLDMIKSYVKDKVSKGWETKDHCFSEINPLGDENALIQKALEFENKYNNDK